MIIYSNNLNSFINDCNTNQIVNEITKSFNNNGYHVGNEREINSWRNSLPRVASALTSDELNGEIGVAIEYKFELNRNRIDLLLYGNNDKRESSVVIVELKQWSQVRRANKTNFVHTNGGGGTKDYLHPSYQAFRYANILKGFNSYVQDEDVKINSCSYLHNLDNNYDVIINNNIDFPYVVDSPVFLENDDAKLKDFVKKYIKTPNSSLLYLIENGRIRPSKEFSKMLQNAIKGQSVFTLDDEQATSVATIVHETKEAIRHNKRKTIIIKGGPGSGKSIVAINAMGILLNKEDSVNTCYCTTNFTPRTLFSEILVDGNYKKNAITQLFKPLATFSRSSEFDYDCIMLDEAHRAFQWKFGQGVKRDVDMIDKFFYSSRVNVFFIDEDQVVTKDDYLTIDKIREYANKYDSEIFESSDLTLSSQFRCLGGENYIDFINSFLGYNNNVSKFISKGYEFKVYDNVNDLWNAIKNKQSEFPKSRLLAGYTHDWISAKDDSLFDFDLNNGNFKMQWNKKVNWSYINDQEQLDKIGSIHTIQGVDMDYAGVIIGKDILYRNGRIVFNKDANANTDKASGIKKADDELAERLIRNTYKVLLSRAVYGTYVYCEDKALGEYLKSFISY